LNNLFTKIDEEKKEKGQRETQTKTDTEI